MSQPSSRSRPPRLGLDRVDRLAALLAPAIVGLAAAALLGFTGVPRLPLHGPWHYLGVMDPLCGGTRAIAAMGRGDWGRAWYFNPGVPIAVAGAVVVVLRAAVGAVSGRWVYIRLPRRLVVAAVVLAAVALEVVQQAHAARLR